MKIEQLYYFSVVVKEGSISDAANKIFMTPQTISKSIANLEKELGAELLTRHPKGVELTKAGQLFYKKVDKLLHDYGQLKADFITEDNTNDFSLSSKVELYNTAYINAEIIEHIMQEMSAQYPHIEISFLELPSELIIPRVIQNNSLGLLTCITEYFRDVYKEMYSDDIVYETMRQEDLGILVNAKSPLVKLKNISLFDVFEHPIVSYHSRDFSKLQFFSSKTLPNANIVTRSSNKRVALQAVQNKGAVMLSVRSYENCSSHIKFIPLKENLHISTLLIKRSCLNGMAENKIIQKIRECYSES